MRPAENIQTMDFTIDQNQLFREESITDLKIGAIRRLIPITPGGAPDPTRREMFIGQAQLMTSEGPLPLQAELAAATLKEAIGVFPKAMKEALSEMVRQIEQLKREQMIQESSRIIVPGR